MRNKMPRFSLPTFSFSFRLPQEIRVPFLISYTLAFLTVILTAGFATQLPPQIPLFYTLAGSANQLVSKTWLLFPPLFAVFIVVFHSLIVQTLQTKHGTLMARFFALATIMVEVLLLVSCLRIFLILM